MSYTKLDRNLILSSVWALDSDTRVVWITMLAIKNRNQIVEGSLIGLAHAARVDVRTCQKALDQFQAPDPLSSSQEYEGRRVQKVDGGWLILNGEKYQNKDAQLERQEQWREAQRRHRNNRRPAPTVAAGPLTPAEMILRQRELEMAQGRLKELKNSYDEHMDWSEADKSERRVLKARIKELMELLGMKITAPPPAAPAHDTPPTPPAQPAGGKPITVEEALALAKAMRQAAEATKP